MGMQDYWRALSAGQRGGLVAGVVVVVACTAALGYWALRDPMVPVSPGLAPERQATLAAELERAKVPYRIADDGTTVVVSTSAAPRARAAIGSGLGIPPVAGLEIFKEADFSTTDFAQRVNYQRALQGELARTLESMTGVQGARVHVVLPESGLLKRSGVKASVAVTLHLVAGQTLSRAQVAGIQRLAAASVPEIKAGDVVVLDASGRTLSRGSTDSEDDASSAQLDLKRQVDGYLEAKLSRLLADLVPGGEVTLSADTALDFKQLKVTTEEPIAASAKGAEHPTGVVVKERQSQRSGNAPAGGGADARGSETSEFEYEYKVGHRIEQSLSVPGAIKRISVAVAVHGAPDSLTPAAIEQLVAHAVGIDRARGDSVVVVLLPRPLDGRRLGAAPAGAEPAVPVADAARQTRFDAFAVPVLLVMVLLLLGCILWLATRRRVESGEAVDIDLATAKVQAWLKQEGVAR